MRKFFLKTHRIGFSHWSLSDAGLAAELWGDAAVTRYITAGGAFTEEQIRSRLQTEIDTELLHHVQYWPIFLLESGAFIGCCGLRPYQRETGVYELGVHLLPRYWRMGLAHEAAGAVIDHAVHTLGARDIFAGHNPGNTPSRRLLEKLGFHYVGDLYYNPTGLFHPSYLLRSTKHL